MSKAERPTKYVWQGKRLADGRPVRHLGDYGIPDRSLTEEETAALTTEQVRILEASGLYRADNSTKQPEPETAKSGGDTPAKKGDG
jgi:hypothetical protein